MHNRRESNYLPSSRYGALSLPHQELVRRWHEVYGDGVDLNSITVITDDLNNSFQAIKKIRGCFEGGRKFRGNDLRMLEGRFRLFMERISCKTMPNGFHEIGLPCRNGFRWVLIDEAAYSGYGNAMQNCGKGRHAHESVYSLCSFDGVHKVTCVVNRGVIMETKGRKNQKPSASYLPNFKDLILGSLNGERIAVASAPRWKPHLDLTLDDFSPQDREEILTARPWFDDVVEFHGQDNFVILDSEIFFSKHLTSEEFNRIARKAWSTTESSITRALIGLHYHRRAMTVPNEMMNFITSDQGAAFEFLLGANTSSLESAVRYNLEQCICVNRHASYSYAKYILEWTEVSDVILGAI